jgi:hypothetical protein
VTTTRTIDVVARGKFTDPVVFEPHATVEFHSYGNAEPMIAFAVELDLESVTLTRAQTHALRDFLNEHFPKGGA